MPNTITVKGGESYTFTSMKLEELTKEAIETDGRNYIMLIENIIEDVLKNETKYNDKIRFEGRMARVKPEGKAVIVGDLHGDIESLIHILKETKFIEKADKNENFLLIFLGDYGDRGTFSAEVYYVVLKLKLMYPDKILLMRGNHEGPPDLPVYPHDLPAQYRARFGESGSEAYKITTKIFDYLLNAVFIEDRYLLVHGGLPEKASSLENFAYAHEMHPKESFLEEILWSDPYEGEGVYPSPRGAGKLFGWNITERILNALNVKILIRGHEPCDEGFKINHFGKVLTLFSRRGPPYFNSYAAYLHVDLSEKFDVAGQLSSFIRQF